MTNLEVIESILVLISNLSQNTDEKTFAFLADLFDELYKKKKEQLKSDTTPQGFVYKTSGKE